MTLIRELPEFIITLRRSSENKFLRHEIPWLPPRKRGNENNIDSSGKMPSTDRAQGKSSRVGHTNVDSHPGCFIVKLMSRLSVSTAIVYLVY
jgi:hypothetical protein